MQVDGKSTVEKRIAGAFKAAGDATGTSFQYLLATSARESDHRPDLAADTSTAKGLFQFVDQTWLELIRREGPSVGLERLAEKITPDGKGGWTVADPKEKAKILSLKTDPLVASVMAGKFTQDNARKLTDALGRAPTDGELYAAHVLGAAGATKLVRLAASEPATAAAVVFPRAAAANPGLFYGKGGAARSVSDLVARLATPRDTAADPTAARIAEAHAALTAGGHDDGSRVALLLRAQAAALVGAEPAAAAAPGTAASGAGGAAPATPSAPSAADRLFVRTALVEKPMPGAADPAGAPAGRLDGWRSRVGRDAFSGLMRSDASAADAAAVWDTRALPGVGRLAPAAAGGLAASSAAGGLAASSAAGGLAGASAAGAPLPAPTVPTVPPVAAAERRPLLPPVPSPSTAAAPLPSRPLTAQPAAPARARALGGAVIAGGGAGGIAHVDPTAPLSLVATATAAPAVAAVEQATGIRPSRMMALATGAPGAPLPMIDPGAGQARPSRLLFEGMTAPSREAIDAGAVRVRTLSITSPAAPGEAAPTPTPAAAPGEAAAAPAAPASEARAPVRRAPRRPLDLVAASRRPTER